MPAGFTGVLEFWGLGQEADKVAGSWREGRHGKTPRTAPWVPSLGQLGGGQGLSRRPGRRQAPSFSGPRFPSSRPPAAHLRPAESPPCAVGSAATRTAQVTGHLIPGKAGLRRLASGGPQQQGGTGRGGNGSRRCLAGLVGWRRAQQGGWAYLSPGNSLCPRQASVPPDFGPRSKALSPASALQPPALLSLSLMAPSAPWPPPTHLPPSRKLPVPRPPLHCAQGSFSGPCGPARSPALPSEGVPHTASPTERLRAARRTLRGLRGLTGKLPAGPPTDLGGRLLLGPPPGLYAERRRC